MSFLDKMKSGMNQVKDKAAQTVEVTRISSQISSKKKERTALLERLGEFVHASYVNGQLADQIGHIEDHSRSIYAVEQELEALELQLMRVKGEKSCSCGAVVPFDSRFCNVCGGVLTQEQRALAPAIQETAAAASTTASANAFCTSCGAQLEPDSQFCTSCGAKAE